MLLLEAIIPMLQDFLQPACASLSTRCLFCRRAELGVPSRLSRSLAEQAVRAPQRRSCATNQGSEASPAPSPPPAALPGTRRW